MRKALGLPVSDTGRIRRVFVWVGKKKFGSKGGKWVQSPRGSSSGGTRRHPLTAPGWGERQQPNWGGKWSCKAFKGCSL